MEIPLWIILVPLALVVACTGLFLFFNIFHLARYGIVGRGAVALILVYLVSYAFIFFLGITVLNGIDWSQAVSPSTILPFFSRASSYNFGI